MQIRIATNVILLISLVCVSTQLAAAERYSWSDIESRGGLAVLTPVQVSENRWFIPLRFDASGRRSICKEPTYIDSFGTVGGVDCKVDKESLRVSLLRGTILKPGTDRVVYGFFVEDCSGKKMKVVYIDDRGETVLGILDFTVVAYPRIGTQQSPP